MSGLRSQQQHPWLARILYYVVNDVAEKLRACEFPLAARAIGAQPEQTLTRSDPQRVSHVKRIRARARILFTWLTRCGSERVRVCSGCAPMARAASGNSQARSFSATSFTT